MVLVVRGFTIVGELGAPLLPIKCWCSVRGLLKIMFITYIMTELCEYNMYVPTCTVYTHGILCSATPTE